jgi:GAF domain-containing protein
VVLLTFWKKAPYMARAWAFVGLLFLIGATDFFDEGLNGSSQALLISSVFAASLLLKRRGSTLIIVLTILTMVIFAWAYSSGLLVDPNDTRSASITEWIPGILVVLLVSAFIITSLNYLIPQLVSALHRSRALTVELESSKITLEEQIRERTASLENRSNLLEATAQITREISSIQDIDRQLETAPQLIAEYLNSYHNSIFLLDESRSFAVLRASNSEIGKHLIREGYRHRVGDNSIIGQASSKAGFYLIADTVAETPIRYDNSDFLETRSEVALPLRAEGDTIGVLNIHSLHPNAFSQEDAIVLQLLADQISLALRNSILYQESQESLTSIQRAYAQTSSEAWQEYLQTVKVLSERYDPQNVFVSEDRTKKTSQQALQKKEISLGGETDPGLLSIPLEERGQIIGVINAYKEPESGKWSQDEIELMKSLSDQLEVALESAQLYSATQRRAEQEQLIGEVTARMRETLDIETVLKTATRELRKSLDLAEVEIQLATDPEDAEQKI